MFVVFGETAAVSLRRVMVRSLRFGKTITCFQLYTFLPASMTWLNFQATGHWKSKLCRSVSACVQIRLCVCVSYKDTLTQKITFCSFGMYANTCYSGDGLKMCYIRFKIWNHFWLWFFFSSGQYRRKFKIIYLGDLWSHVCIYKLTSFLVQIAFDNKRNRLNTCFFQQVDLEGIKLKTAN